MNEENKDKDQKKKSDREKKLKAEMKEKEIEKILSDANSKTGEQLEFGELGAIKSQDKLKEFALGHIPDDPEEKYNVYYKGIERLLKKFLPTSNKHKFARDIIREEKNIFLTRGNKLNERGIRGADSRMAYIQDMEFIMNLIIEWARESGNYFDLYSRIRDKNKELGYHDEFNRT